MAYLATINEVYVNVEYISKVWVDDTGAVMINDGNEDHVYVTFPTKEEASLCALDLVKTIGEDVIFFSRDTYDNKCADVDRIFEYNEQLNAMLKASDTLRKESEKCKV